jgi:hypothetical protein
MLLLLFLLVKWIYSGAYLKILDNEAFETTVIMVNWQATATTSDADQAVILKLYSNKVGKEIYIRTHLSIANINQLRTGDTFDILYSPKFRKAIEITPKNRSIL